MNEHNYLVKSVLKSTAVQHAVGGSFSRPGVTEYVLAKGTILELVVPSEDGTLVSLCEQPVFGSICNLQLLPWNDAFQSAALPPPLVGCDLLVLLSDSSDLAFVGFDRQLQRFFNVGRVDLMKEGFSRTRTPALVAVDPAGRGVAVAAEAEHLALFHASPTAGARLMEGAHASAPGLGHLSWEAILSMAFVRPSDEETDKAILKLAVIVQREESPGHQVQILLHDTRDWSTHLWARLPPSVNICPTAEKFLPLLVLAPPHMPDTLLIGRAGDIVALDLSSRGPVVRATWNLVTGGGAYKETVALGFGALDLNPDAQKAPGVRIRADKREAEVGWELDLKSPDAEKTRLAKKRARGGQERPVDPSGGQEQRPVGTPGGGEPLVDCSSRGEVSFGEWNRGDLHSLVPEGLEADSTKDGGPSISSYSWRSDGSEAFEGLVVSLADGGLQALELRRSPGMDGPDLKFVPRGSCDGNTCQACSAVVWLRGDVLGAFVRGGDGHVMKLSEGLEMTSVAEITNVAPIVDFQVVDHFDEKQDQVFACCGEGSSGGLRVIRGGISAERLLSTPPAYEGVAGVWAMRMSARDPHHAFLVMSFVSGTRVLSVGLSFDDVTESIGFQQHASTLACGPIQDCHVVQICAQAIHLCAPTRKAHPSGIAADQPYTATWHPSDGACISVGAVSNGRVIAGLSRPSGLVMLGVENRPSDGHVALVQLQSCRVEAELSCISLQDDDVIGPPDAVSTRAGSSQGGSVSASGLDLANDAVSPDARFAAQARRVCLLGTYRPSIEVRSAVPGDDFRLVASIPLEAGTTFQQKGMSPGLGSDVRMASVPVGGCVPESVLLSFFDRGYLLVGLRNGLLARYEWPTGQLERVINFPEENRNSASPDPSSTSGAGVNVNTTDTEPNPLSSSTGVNNPPLVVNLAESSSNRPEVLVLERGSQTPTRRIEGLTSGRFSLPLSLVQVGEKRVGSTPVSLLSLAYANASGENLDAFPRSSDGFKRSSDAFGQPSEASARLGNGPYTAPISSVFSDVLALSNQPWLLHRSPWGRGRMMMSLVSHPTSAHATAVSCGECPRGIVFMTDCCMHLVELDPSKKMDIRKLASSGAPRRLIYHPTSKSLVTLSNPPVDSPGDSYPPLQCVNPETGAILCSDTSFAHTTFPHTLLRCLSLSPWGGGTGRDANPPIVMGTAHLADASRAVPDVMDGSLLDPESETYMRGCLFIFRLTSPTRGWKETQALGGVGSFHTAETQEQWQLDSVNLRNVSGPVLATCQLRVGPHGAVYLAVAMGCNVYVFASANPAEVTSRLIVVAKTRTRFPVVALSPAACHVSSEAWLFVGDSRDGVLLYTFQPGARRLELLFADKERRALADLLAAPGDMKSAFLADGEGGLGVLSADERPVNSRSPEFNLGIRAWFNLGDSPTRLRLGSLFDHQSSPVKPLAQSSDQSPGGAYTPREANIVVSTASGGIISLEKMQPREFELLELVQQSLAAFPATAPLMGNDYAAFRAQGSKAKGRPMLEADFLTQFLDLPESQQEAVLTARFAPLAQALAHLMGGEEGVEFAEDGVVDLETCKRLREITMVLIENL